jgi:putative ubiquitin-RnfH superfamily antitoxin RatB of RatAB toxin-antitoxin module
MGEPFRKRCVVVYATRDEQWLWQVEVAADATVEEVVSAARIIANREDVPWATAPVGIFGQPCNRSEVPVEGDRIELYRPLASDPRERRRARVQTQRRAARSGGDGKSGS